MAEVKTNQHMPSEKALENYFRHRQPEKVSDDEGINDVLNLLAAKFSSWMYEDEIEKGGYDA